MAFRVETTEQAQRDAEEILEWLLCQDAGKAAVQWFQALENAVASVAAFPERRPVPENREFPI